MSILAVAGLKACATSMPLIIDEKTVRQLLPMSDLIDAMDAALAAFSTGKVRQPVRSIVELGQHGVLGLMPASLDEPRAAGAKLVTVVPANHERGLPSHLATIVLVNAETGALEAILDGRYITEARTAAVSAVSARHLARADSRIAAIIGSGVQARSHADALARVRPLQELRIWSPTAAHREQAARDIQASLETVSRPDRLKPVPTVPHAPTLESAPNVRAAASAREAVEGADIVILVTSSATPVIEDDWIADGTHVIGVGACRPNQREMPAALVERAKLIVDSRDAAMKEAGDVLLALEDGKDVRIAAELGELCAGTAPGRTARDDVTIFKSLGLAVEDIVSADLVLSRARDTGVGINISI